jgi:lipopolysaccharide/colanic/teichoic acid biosynthesis glycosyltransferase
MRSFKFQMMIRISDIFFSLLGLLILSPVLLLIAIIIIIDSKGGVFFIQERVGRNNSVFKLIKFRTMVPYSDKSGTLTVGMRDPRITRTGYYLRKFKIDELPQLINVLIGDMSLVGPRPEVRRYVNEYTEEQKKVLCVRPGITDYASIEFSNENEILSRSENPEKTYIEDVLPAKIRLNMRYISKRTMKTYFKILFLTFREVIKNSK